MLIVVMCFQGLAAQTSEKKGYMRRQVVVYYDVRAEADDPVASMVRRHILQRSLIKSTLRGKASYGGVNTS